MPTKTAFIQASLSQLTLGAALRRSSIYAEGVSDTERQQFREHLIGLVLQEARQHLRGAVREDAHLESILRISYMLRAHFDGTFRRATAPIGVVQKALNLYLKYLWCLGYIGQPPHCPFDSIVIQQIPAMRGIKWTEIGTIADYEELVQSARAVASPQSLAEWELTIFPIPSIYRRD